MQVAASWVVLSFIGGGLLGVVLAALLGASKVSDAKEMADRWRCRALESDRQVDELLAALARERREIRGAGMRAELAKVLADEPGAQPVTPCPVMAVHEGADKYPFAAAAGLVAPSTEAAGEEEG
jgi:hypothetical protein